MFCSQCKMTKAEVGCYLPGKFERVCLSCYRSATGLVPLPTGAAGALGGKFADGAKLGAAYTKQSASSTSSLLTKLSKTAATAGVKVLSSVAKEVVEAEIAAQRQIMGVARNLTECLYENTSDAVKQGTSAAVNVLKQIL